MNETFADVILYDTITSVSEGSDMVDETFYPHQSSSSKHGIDTVTKSSSGSRRAKIVQVRRSKKNLYGPSKFERLHDTKLLFKHVHLSRFKRRKYSADKNPKVDIRRISIDALPNDVLENIMKLKLMDSGDVMSAGQTCVRWHNICKRVWQKKKSKELSDAWAKSDHIPSTEELATVELLVDHKHLTSQIIPRKVAALTDSWDRGDYFPSASEVAFVALLASNGHLHQETLDSKAAKIIGILNDDDVDSTSPSLALVACAAALATHGYITEVESLCLDDLDLGSVSAEDLVNLVECVRHHISIYDGVRGDLGLVLSNVKCETLAIADINLSTADTQNLLTAMVNCVESVQLLGDVALDFDILSQYDGKGACEEVELFNNTNLKHRERVMMWMEKIDWKYSTVGLAMNFTREAGEDEEDNEEEDICEEEDSENDGASGDEEGSQ